MNRLMNDNADLRYSIMKLNNTINTLQDTIYNLQEYNRLSNILDSYIFQLYRTDSNMKMNKDLSILMKQKMDLHRQYSDK